MGGGIDWPQGVSGEDWISVRLDGRKHHTHRNPVTPGRSGEEVTATIVTFSCVLLLVILLQFHHRFFSLSGILESKNCT